MEFIEQTSKGFEVRRATAFETLFTTSDETEARIFVMGIKASRGEVAVKNKPGPKAGSKRPGRKPGSKNKPKAEEKMPGTYLPQVIPGTKPADAKLLGELATSAV